MSSAVEEDRRPRGTDHGPVPGPDVDPVPSLGATAVLCASTEVPDDVDALGILVAAAGGVPDVVGLPRTALAAAGFRGRIGEALLLPRPTGPAVVAIGSGPGGVGPGGVGPGGVGPGGVGPGGVGPGGVGPGGVGPGGV